MDMSYANFGDSYQGQQPAEDGGAPGTTPAQPQHQQIGQHPDPSQGGSFPPHDLAAQGAPGSAQPEQGGENDPKTTLW